MSYIPDFRKETDKLNEVDRAYIGGYRSAMDEVVCFFDNINDYEELSIVKEIAEKVKDSLVEWLQHSEIETVCSLFDNADYLPEDTELVDANQNSI